MTIDWINRAQTLDLTVQHFIEGRSQPVESAELLQKRDRLRAELERAQARLAIRRGRLSLSRPA